MPEELLMSFSTTGEPEQVIVEHADGSKVISRETYEIIRTIVDAKTIKHIPSIMDDPEYNLELTSGSQG
jgi:hypothetical protein